MKVDDYDIEVYRRGWKLTTWYDGKDKDGSPKRQSRDTYYPTLKQTLESICDDAAGRLTTAQELLNQMADTSRQIEQILSKNGLV